MSSFHRLWQLTWGPVTQRLPRRLPVGGMWPEPAVVVRYWVPRAIVRAPSRPINCRHLDPPSRDESLPGACRRKRGLRSSQSTLLHCYPYQRTTMELPRPNHPPAILPREPQTGHQTAIFASSSTAAAGCCCRASRSSLPRLLRRTVIEHPRPWLFRAQATYATDPGSPRERGTHLRSQPGTPCLITLAGALSSPTCRGFNRAPLIPRTPSSTNLCAHSLSSCPLRPRESIYHPVRDDGLWWSTHMPLDVPAKVLQHPDLVVLSRAGTCSLQ